MAKLYISEYSVISRDSRGNEIHIPSLPAVAEQAIDFTAGETDSQPFNENTRYIRIVSDETCNFVVAPSAPTATTNSAFLPPNVVEYFGVQPGHILSVI